MPGKSMFTGQDAMYAPTDFCQKMFVKNMTGPLYRLVWI